MRTAQRQKVHHAGRGTSRDPNHYRAAKDARSRLLRVYADENVARCHRCPPQSFCSTCGPLNKARIQLGLIRPKHTEDHRNNILYAIPIVHKGKVGTPTRNIPGQVVTASIRQLGAGWRQGIATLNGEVIYEGPKTRDQAAAWAYANASKEAIKEGLRFEMVLNA